MEETILIECSRQSSLEGTTGNYTTLAEWTCDTGDGIILDIGDKITLQGGFVSEKGAEVGEIEIKERDRGQTVSAEVSKDIQYKNPIPEILPSQPGEIVSWNEVYKYGCEIGGNETIPFKLNDGETNIIYSPYKTANGEFYATLPRRHIGVNASVGPGLTNLNPFNVFDCNDGPAYTGHNWGAGAVGNIVYTLDGENPDFDWNFQDAWQFCPADYKLVISNGEASEPAASGAYTRRKGMILNDNSRYTLFRAKTIYRTASAANDDGGNLRALLGGDATNASTGPGTVAYQKAYDLRDPAVLYDWEQVRHAVKLSSKQGFNKPQDVSTELTQQLNLRGEPINKKITHLLNKNSGEPTVWAEKTLYSYYESPCYKAYNCATSIWDVDRWNYFKKVENTTQQELDNAHVYMSMYQHIGIKRPDLHIQGRLTNGPTGFLKSSSGDGRNTPHNAQVLNLGIPWTEENLLNLNKLFEIQGKYPELFTDVNQEGPHANGGYFDITPGNHRFLHFNKQDEATNSASITRHCPDNSLGYDLYGQNASTPSTGYYTYDNTMASYPIFFDFNASTVNLKYNDVGYCEDALGGVSDIDDLAYGWARKMRIDASVSVSGLEKYYIGVQFTKTGGGVPEFLYNGQSHIALSTIAGNTGRRFGWDYHFSAYGNPCMILYSGLVNKTDTDNSVNCIDETEAYKIAQSIDDTSLPRNTGAAYHTIMLGADNPAVGYDSTEERFYLTNLHMSETLGNPSNAGKVGTGNPPVGGIPANANATTTVYKVNKRMLGTSYCPNVAPYSASLTIPQTGNYPAQIMLSNNIQPFIPYDAQGGLFVEEVVIPEKYWDSNLIGVLGFDYSQFTNTDTSRQVSIKDRLNATNMKFLTTQAPINLDDLITWNKNGFGNDNFGITPALSYLSASNTARKGIIPAVTVILPEGYDSTRITALELPTKTARPYYAIRSDIVPQNNFYGGNQDLVKATAASVNRPVIAIINKTNGYGDFYSAEFNMPVFTNTAKRVITQIKTSVHDPDGSYAKVNKSCSVIYKIIKDKKIDLTPVQTLLESKKKSDVLIGDAAASMLKDPRNAKPNYNFAFT